ncbi:uncharacterized protein Eint_060040 [Encephalitozoon intestinalis ATCC 50506]|uniref:Uncharacterized protein n=1 Tax=Encephalitozoon intestinalis (strain ATCC 50506) TaxID=876142 RepID=E0S7D4_ENCIT|nr:uncharacterized protein Eint_060040 [Encephalitozoon intestinalis ATCC 50506]ADM11613.1 hypothetical protein Eint_060040 [Encephalitozoon intestinalis ATCC 50506]UTX45340.1 WD40 domain-containing protein [Encephalitozoon intestinalis]
MKLNLFKNIKRKPFSIVAMSSNGTTIVLFRKDKTLELFDSYTLVPYFTMEFGYEVVTSSFVDFHTVACGTECGKLVFFNTRTLDIMYTNVDGIPSNIAANSYGLRYDQRLFYYSIGCNVYEKKNMDADLVYRGNSKITSLFLSPDQSLIIGDAEGKIKMLRCDKMVSEIQLSSGKINMICHITGNTYVSVCDYGNFYYFDTDLELVLQTVKVRNSPLNVCAYVNDKLHLSGADSRIVAFSRNGRKFIKSYQVDTHYAEVRNIAVDNGRVLTSGEDTIMSVVWPTPNKYLENKIFHRSVELEVSKVNKMFYINNRSSIDFYLLDSDPKDNNDEETSEDLSQNDMGITFKLSRSSIKNIGYKSHDYKYKIKIYTEGNAFCSSAPDDFSYLAYSNSTETRVISLSPDQEIKVRNRLGKASRLITRKDLIVLQSYKREVLLIDLKTGETLRKILFDDYREVVYLVGDLLVLGHSKVIYSISDPSISSSLDVEGEVLNVCEYGKDHFIVLSMAKSLEAKKEYFVYKVSLSDFIVEKIKFFETYSLITSVSVLEDNIIFSSSNAIQIFDNEMREERYSLGAVIYSCKAIEGEIIAIQDSWNNIRLGLPPSIFKEKFSNK